MAAAEVSASVRGRIQRIEDRPTREVALVLGAPPGRLLTARMETACALVREGLTSSLVLSGMPDEMPFMQARARTCLPDDKIVIDDAAARTLESFVRARDRLGVRSALVVTQAYHLPRALALADALGVDAIGVIAAGEPSASGWARERVAVVRAWVDVRRVRAAR